MGLAQSHGAANQVGDVPRREGYRGRVGVEQEAHRAEIIEPIVAQGV